MNGTKKQNFQIVEKKFYTSKTLIMATFMLVLLFVDYFFPNFLSLSEVGNKFSEVIGDVNNDGHVDKFNFGAFLSLVTMVVLRFVTKSKVKL